MFDQQAAKPEKNRRIDIHQFNDAGMTTTVPSDAADGDLQLVTGVPQGAREDMHWCELMTDVIQKK